MKTFIVLAEPLHLAWYSGTSSKPLAGYEKASGPEHKQALDRRYNLGLLYDVRSMFGNAVQQFELFVQGYTKVLGPEHGETVEALKQLKIVKSIRREERGVVVDTLLDRRGADVQITEKVVEAAAGNWENSKDIMTLLLDRRGADVQIAKEAVKVIAKEFDQDIITLLLDRREL